MGEWLGFIVSLAMLPVTLADEWIQRRKYAAWKAAQRQKQVDEANGL